MSVKITSIIILVSLGLLEQQLKPPQFRVGNTLPRIPNLVLLALKAFHPLDDLEHPRVPSAKLPCDYIQHHLILSPKSRDVSGSIREAASSFGRNCRTDRHGSPHRT